MSYIVSFQQFCISQKLIKLLLSGTCASDEVAAIYLCKSDILPSLIELLKAKQEDDEIVLQVVYVFYQLCSHAGSRQYVKVSPNQIPRNAPF